MSSAVSSPSAPGRLRGVLRWVPGVIVTLVQAGAWIALFSGGMTGVWAWVLLLSLIRTFPTPSWPVFVAGRA